MLISRARRCILALIIVGALLATPGSMATATAGGVATLLVLAGSVTVNGTAGPMAAANGQTVQLGDEIWTAPDGIALLTFFDGSETQLQSDTHITLEAPAVGTGVSIYQSAGTTVNHVHHLAPNASFQTDTPTAVAMVRGTTYVVTAAPMSDPVATSSPTDLTTMPVEDGAVSVVAPVADTTSIDAPPAIDLADQQSAAVATVPLFDPTSASTPNACVRERPTSCLTSVILLADADGHVGHVEVASHIAGHPTQHLTAHGDAAHVSHAGAVRQPIQPQHLTQLHEAAQHLQDVQRARQAHVAAQLVVHLAKRPVSPGSPTPHP